MADHTTADRVTRWLGMTSVTPDDALRVADVVGTVNAWVTEHTPAADVPTEASKQGATMLAARLYRRRNTPGGVDASGPDGAVYVPRRDFDVDMLLRIGNHAPPIIG